MSFLGIRGLHFHSTRANPSETFINTGIPYGSTEKEQDSINGTGNYGTGPGIAASNKEGTKLSKKEKGPTLHVQDMVINDEHTTVTVDDDLRTASKKMLANKVSLALVLDDQDRVRGLLRSNDILDKVLEGVSPEKTPVTKVMIRDFFKIKYNDDLAKLAPKIHRSGHKYIVVLDERGRYKGYFSINDLRHSREILYKMGYNPFE